ncbi:MAG TPA: glycosyltransferase family 2 protein [Bdellovibrionales bacterium]|nr:glycosyltransferase family 2 protein [Bdellovibrionales bacterium]
MRKLSLAIICLNEAQNIERCIRSVPFADEIIVLDSGSTDDTLAIAKSLGAKTYNEEWRGFRAQKQRATELCTNDWVLSLDADEALSEEAQKEVNELFESPVELNQFDGYDFPRKSWNLGRWITHGGWYPDRQLRLYNQKRAQWRGGERVHERVYAEKVGNLTQPILHWPFPTHSEQVATNNRYSSLGAEELYARGKRFSLAKLIFKPWSKFMETYFIKLGCLDGMPGFIISVGAAYSVFLKFVKLWEIEKSKK